MPGGSVHHKFIDVVIDLEFFILVGNMSHALVFATPFVASMFPFSTNLFSCCRSGPIRFMHIFFGGNVYFLSGVIDTMACRP